MAANADLAVNCPLKSGWETGLASGQQFLPKDQPVVQKRRLRRTGRQGQYWPGPAKSRFVQPRSLGGEHMRPWICSTSM